MAGRGGSAPLKIARQTQKIDQIISRFLLFCFFFLFCPLTTFVSLYFVVFFCIWCVYGVYRNVFYWFAWFRCRPSYSINYAMKEREERRKGIFVFASDRHTDADTQHLIRRGHTQSTKRCQMKLPAFSLLAAAGILCGYIFIWRWKKDKILPSCVYNNRDDGDHKSSSRNGGAISKRRIDANHFNSPKNTKKRKKETAAVAGKT